MPVLGKGSYHRDDRGRVVQFSVGTRDEALARFLQLLLEEMKPNFKYEVVATSKHGGTIVVMAEGGIELSRFKSDIAKLTAWYAARREDPQGQAKYFELQQELEAAQQRQALARTEEHVFLTRQVRA